MSKNVRRLFAEFAPKHYNLHLVPDRETLKLAGKVTIKGQKTGRPSKRLTFHQNGVKITSATISNHSKKGDRVIAVTRINHHQSLHEVRLHTAELLYPGEYTIDMEFQGAVQSSMQGVYYSSYKVGDVQKRLVSTQFESHFARQAFPCIDEPEAKAVFALTLTSPADEAVLANMPIQKQQRHDTQLVTTFEPTPKMSPYLLAFAYGDLQYKEAKTKSGIPVRVWATKTHQPHMLDFALETAVRGNDFFEEYFDTPFPLPKIDHLAVPDFSAAGMENWGLVTYREMALLADPASMSQLSRELIAEVILHEISHQWFGDLVTMRWWDNLWLNESFANVMAFVAIDTLFPEWQIWDNYIASDGLAAFRRDSLPGVQAVKTDVHHPDEIHSVFDPSIVYAKGGRLINMLMQHLGQDAFRKGLKDYFAKHGHANTTGQDLWEALSAASQTDVAAIMEPWLHQSGFPALEVAQKGRELNLTQSHFLVDPQKADTGRTWPIPLLSDMPGVPKLLTESTVTLTLPETDFVRINRDAIGHYIVHYNTDKHVAFMAELAAKKRLSPAERLALLHDSSLLARAGNELFASTLTLLQHYDQEDTEPVWDIMGVVLADARRFIDIDKNLEQPIKALVRKLIDQQYKRLGWQERKGESSQDTKLRALIIGLGSYAEQPEVIAKAKQLFTAYQQDATAIVAELRPIVFGTVVRENVPGAFEYLLNLEEQTNDVNLKLECMDALTTTHQTKHATLLLARLTDSSKVRQQDATRWLALLLRNRHTRTVAWQWLQDNWQWLYDTFKDDHALDYIPRYVASAFNTAQQLQEYKDFFGPLQNNLALRRSITLGIEELENRAAWLKRDLPGVQSFFAKPPTA